MPGTRARHGAAVSGGLLYVVGGLVDGVLPSASPLWIYDPAADSWTTGASLPAVVHGAPLVAHGGRLYLIGGFRGTGSTTVNIDSMWVYDIASDSWAPGPVMPTARGNPSAAVLGDQIHVIGGVGVSNNFGPVAPFIEHEIYDIPSSGWITGTAVLNGRELGGLVAVDGKLYAVAGRSAGVTVNRTNIYDPATQQWTQGAVVPTPRAGGATVAFQGEVYLLGGELLPEGFFFGPGEAVAPDTPGADVYEVVEVYDPATDTWRTGDPLPSPRNGLAAGVIGNAIFAVGGGPSNGTSLSAVNERWTP